MRRGILDTGPLVAWLCPRDRHHQWARLAFGRITGQGIVCEAVLTEVRHLASKEGIAQAMVADLVIDGGLELGSLSDDMPDIRTLMNTCVTRPAERIGEAWVCTTDTDFVLLRKNSTGVIPLIAPFAQQR
jgi:hypothetical protein